MTHYTNTGNPIDFPKKKDIPMLEKFAAQSLVEYDGELIFSKEKFAELIIRECAGIACEHMELNEGTDYNIGSKIKQHFGVED
jgi:hypothetical protein